MASSNYDDDVQLAADAYTANNHRELRLITAEFNVPPSTVADRAKGLPS